MKKFARILFVILVVGVIIAVSGCGTKEKPKTTTENKATYEFKLGHVTQATHPFNMSAEAFVKRVTKKSDSRIKITIYPARQLGDDAQELEAIIAGNQDMGSISSSQFASYTPVFAGLQLPWLIDDYTTQDKVLHSSTVRKMLDSLEKYNLKGLAVFGGSYRDLLFKNKKVTAPDQMKGMKIRVAPSEVLKDWALAEGATAVPLPYGEVYNALNTGMLDGVEINPSSVKSEKLYETSKYMLDTNEFPFPTILVMNLKTYNKLSAEDKKILQDAANESITDSVNFNKDEEKTSLEFIQKNGVTVYSADMTSWKAPIKPVYDKWIAKDPLIKELVDYVNKLKKK